MSNISNNVHGFDDYAVKNVEIKSSSDTSKKANKCCNTSMYKILTVTTFLLLINIALYIVQIVAYYAHYKTNKKSWKCLLVNFGAFQGGKIRYHYHYHRFITSMFLHNSVWHIISNAISLFFVGYQVEYDINNKIFFALLYFISGLEGDFLSLMFNQNNISVGASGAILGLCGYFVIYFVLYYKTMNNAKKISFGIIFIIILINLFSGLTEVSINMACHIGGFLGGLAFSTIILYRRKNKIKFKRKLILIFIIISIIILILLPILSIIILYLVKVSKDIDYICET